MDSTIRLESVQLLSSGGSEQTRAFRVTAELQCHYHRELSFPDRRRYKRWETVYEMAAPGDSADAENRFDVATKHEPAEFNRSLFRPAPIDDEITG